MKIKIPERDLAEWISSGLVSPELCADIDARDEIYAFLAMHPAHKDRPALAYFESGNNAFLSLVRVLHDFGRSLSSTHGFLEFACGFGRVTRHLVRALSASKVDVSDIVAEAVEFQKATFNVRGFVSHEDPDQCVIPAQYDVIFVASLFSHLPEALWRPWLRKLHGALAPDGMLIFSAHGPKCVPAGHSIGNDGILYFMSSESKVLDAKIYGTTYVTRDFVDRNVKEILGRPPLAVYEQGMWGYQDIYVVGNSSPLEKILIGN